MAEYPSGLPTRKVAFGKAVAMEAGLPLTVTLTIVASRSLYHEPSGTPLVAITTKFTSETPGSAWTVELPVTDSDDMRLLDGGTVVLEPGQQTHTYSATMTVSAPDATAAGGITTSLPRREVSRQVIGPFALPSSSTDPVEVVDLLALPDPVPGVVVSYPADVQMILDALQEASEQADRAEAEADRAAASLPEPGPPGPPGPPVDVSFDGLTLSSSSPAVGALSNVNEWIVSDAVQVVLPTVDPGFQCTVHVVSGFQNLSWPNGTEVYGETDQQDVWVTLIRAASGWVVLIPSPVVEDGGGGLDTGWVNYLVGFDLGGTPSWSVGDPEVLGDGWGIAGGADFGLSVALRRIDNVLHVALVGLARTGTGGGEAAITLPVGIHVATSTVESAVVPYHTAASQPAGLLVATVNQNRLLLRTLDGQVPPVGTILGRTSGTNVYGRALISIPLIPSAPWGT